MRTGWAESHKNAVALARVFEDAGVQMLTVHGRTREQGYRGQAEYDTIAAVKAA
ncbi:tRNA-dihydrouridine synthase, partial [Neisseria gonorrhoeae]|nr:tRNA-dihydrouridine synthase [Neisseria gonorrhoeae]